MDEEEDKADDGEAKLPSKQLRRVNWREIHRSTWRKLAPDTLLQMAKAGARHNFQHGRKLA